MNLETGLQLDILGMLRRRSEMLVAVTGGVFLAAYWVAMALPNEYTASATIFVEPQSISERLVQAGLNASDLNHRLNLMSAQILSRPRLSRIIDELGLYQNQSDSMLREQIIQLMRSKIDVVPVIPQISSGRGRDAAPVNTFIVTFSADDARVAAEVAQRLANDFLQEHIELRVDLTQKSLEFIQSERERLDERIREVDAETARIKNENPGRLPEDMLTNQRVLERTIVELREAQRAHDSASTTLAFWENQAVSLAELGGPADESSPAKRLQTLQLQLADLKARGYTEKHPDVLATQQGIVEVEAQMKAAATPGEARPTTATELSVESEIQRAKMAVNSAALEIKRLQEEFDRIQARIIATPKVAEQLEALERSSVQLLGKLSDFTNRYEEARLQVVLERRQFGEQFRILESAYPPADPSSPNRPLILLMGLLLGLVLSASLAVILESANTSFHGSADLQSAISVPVLAAIPRILLDADLAARRRRWIRNALAASAVVFVCLLGGVATYIVVNGAPSWLSIPSDEQAPEPDSGADSAAAAAMDTRG